MPEIELDPGLLSDFIIESRELLDDFTARVIELENKPGDSETIGAIFRAAHTLKGSSAFFNLVHIKNFAHKMENLLDEVRNKKRSATPAVIDVLLAGGNHLKAMFERLNDGDYSTAMLPDEDQFLQQLLQMLEESPEQRLTPEDALNKIREITSSYRQSGLEAAKAMDDIDGLLARLGFKHKPEETTKSDTVSSLPANAYSCRGVDMTEAVSRALSVLAKAEATGDLDAESYDQALKHLEQAAGAEDLHHLRDPLLQVTDDFRAIKDSGIGFDELLTGMVRDKFNAWVSLLSAGECAAESSAPEVPAEEDIPAASSAEESSESKNSKPAREERAERKTMRIDEEKVDGFMSYVGELIVTAETFNYLQKMVESQKVDPLTARAFKNANQAFRELSDGLQESLMEIRRVPIKGLLQKVNIMARELSHQIGKPVKVHLQGQDVQVDKSIAENLEGPLVHVVRNSLDHGLERPEVRTSAGKPPEGVLHVSARADKEFFYLDVSDDGNGIDPDKIRQAAVEKGVINESQAAAMPDAEAVNLIFSPGFSTANEITDVSGRGVGMDVVRTNVQKLNGSIQVESTVGQGTDIHLKIPLSITLQVIKGLLVRVGVENFIIPLDEIVETLRPAREDLTTIEGRGEIVRRRGHLLPLVRLYKVFGIKPDGTDPTSSILIITQTPKGRFGLMVDQVLGQQQVVVKELEAQFKKLSFLAGCATLGDGRLGLVLDSEGVISLAQTAS